MAILRAPGTVGAVLVAVYAMSALATVLAWIVARHRPEHRPIAVLLGYGLAASAARRAIRIGVLEPARAELAGAPFSGWVRAVFHLDSALFLGWMAGVAALAVFIFGRRRPWGVLAVYLVAVAVLAAGYPTFRGELLGKAYLALELAALCTSVGCLILWFLGNDRGKTQHLAAGFIVIAETLMLVGPFRMGIFSAWDLARSILIALYISLVPVQGVAIWRRTL
ncbi:hypothetical protein WME90_01550 [Sorangium sp. So ce375]|uniref:hypothetical protein n=1 Tax=Sorangium sp. So ce375 TaxID=3133306 RepID=UPI003F5BF262